MSNRSTNATLLPVTSLALLLVIGLGSEEIVSSGDPVADAKARENFLAMYDEKHVLAPESEDKVWLQIGADGWSDDVGGPSRFVSVTAEARLTTLLRPSVTRVGRPPDFVRRIHRQTGL